MDLYTRSMAYGTRTRVTLLAATDHSHGWNGRRLASLAITPQSCEYQPLYSICGLYALAERFKPTTRAHVIKVDMQATVFILKALT